MLNEMVENRTNVYMMF